MTTNNKNLKLKGYLLIALAGISWGTTGTLVKFQMDLGITSEEIAFIRMFFGALVLLMYILFTKPKLLKIDARGIAFTAVIGLVTQASFNFAFFNAIRLIGVASSTVLLYLSPLFVLIWSILFFKEKMDKEKIIGVIVCVVGSYIAVTGGKVDVQNLSIIGVILGVSSAIAYSLVSVFSKFGLEKYESETIIFYSFIFGSIFTMPFISINKLIMMTSNIKFVLLSIGLATFSSSIAYVLYFKGISTGIDLSKVGVISVLELIVSIILSVTILKEYISPIKGMGIMIICISIFIIQSSDMIKKREKKKLVHSQC